VPATIDVATLRTILVADSSQFNKELKQAEGLGAKFGQSLQTIGKAAISAGLAGITTAVAGLGVVVNKTLPLASGFADSIVDLDLAAPEAAGSLEDLRQAALMVGGDADVLGASASGAAEAMTGLFKSGLDVNAIMGDMQGYLAGTADLSGALKGAFDLAAASELDVVQASDLASIALSTFGGSLESGEKQAEFISIALNNLVQAADASVAEVADLAEGLAMVGPTAAQLGIGIQDTNNALALLSTAGIAGSRAGSNLDAALRSLTDPTADAEDALAELGVTLFDEQGNFKDLASIVGDFEGALEGMTEEQRAARLGTIFTAQGQRAMNVLLEAGAEGWQKMADATENATTLEARAAAKAATLSGQWEAFQGNLETFGIQIGEVFMPFAQELLTWAGQIAEEYGPPLLEWFQGVGEAVLPLVQRIGELVLEGGTLNDWLDLLPAGLQPVIDGITNLVELVTPFVQRVVAWIQENVKLQDVLIGLGVAIASVVIPAIISIVGPIAATFAVVVGAVMLLRKAWEKNWGDIQGKTKIVVDWLKTNVPIAIEKAREFWEEKLKPALVTVYEYIRDNVIPIVMDIVAWLEENIPIAIEEARRVWEEVLQPALNTVYEFIRDQVIPIVMDIVDWLEVNIPKAIEEARRVWEEVLLPALTSVWDFLDQYILPIFRTLIDIFVLELKIIIEVLAGLWENVLLPALEAIWKYLDENVLPIFRDLIDWLGGESGLMPILEKVAGFLNETFLKALTLVGDKIKDVRDWLGGLLEKLSQWRKTDVPDSFNPGSPPPLALALRDINTAMAEMSQLRLPQLQQAWAGVSPTAGAPTLGQRVASAVSNVDRSASVTVNASYANAQSESNVARDVQTTLELLGWR
jgi:TP901 family phage tail tape measure protein